MEKSLPPIPVKRYFTIGEVGDLCGVKPHVLRYWEQEFTQLRPIKRRGNRRYYQHHEVLMIRRIRDLLYQQGFTISGARVQLQEQQSRDALEKSPLTFAGIEVIEVMSSDFYAMPSSLARLDGGECELGWPGLRQELCEIRELLSLQPEK